ncbi:CsgG/HfaB family protein [Desulfocurvus sp. DL9XJH121]
MLRNYVVACLLAMGMLASGCATMSKPKVEKIPATAPVVSKTIKAEQSQKYTGLKRKVAIARFTNETKYGQSFFLDKDNNPVGKQAVDILSHALLASEKFILLERADLGKIADELKMGDASPLKNMADYLIVGSVTEFGRKEQGKVGIFSRTKEQVAFAKVHIRLIDVASGAILYAEEGEGLSSSEAGSVFGVGARAGYDSTLNDKALEAAIVNLSSNIIENLMDKPWRSYIIAKEEGNFIIGGGSSQGIKPGDTFDVVRKGKTIVNPQTNMPVTLPGKKIASLRVLASAGDTPQNEVSFCELDSGSLDGVTDFSLLYIQEPK